MTKEPFSLAARALGAGAGRPRSLVMPGRFIGSVMAWQLDFKEKNQGWGATLKDASRAWCAVAREALVELYREEFAAGGMIGVLVETFDEGMLIQQVQHWTRSKPMLQWDVDRGWVV